MKRAQATTVAGNDPEGSPGLGASFMSDTSRFFTAVELSGTPERIPLLPVPGTYQHPSFGTIDLSAERIARFVTNHNQRVYQDQIPIDAEHQTKLSGALGYLGDAVVEADGSVSAAVTWTPRGETLVRGGGFKYVSPEWYESWQEPGTGTSHTDVLIGAAVTTRPFFKDRSLPRMVASEDGLDVPPVRLEGDAGNTHAQELASRQATEKDMTEATPVTMTEEQVNGLITAAIAEQSKQFTDLSERFKLVEAENVTLKNESRMRQFREEVTGKSDANGLAWFGDIERHITILDALDDEARKAYVEQQREHAKAMHEAGLFKAAGSGHGSDGGGSALDAINAKAATLAAEKSISKEQAFAEVITNDRELAARYMKER